MARIIVTGGSGKVGRACIEELLQHGYEVFNLDTTSPHILGSWVYLDTISCIRQPILLDLGENNAL